jgi:hypothetical protein
VLGVVQLGPDKPLGAWHLARSEHPPVRLRGLDAAVLPDSGPEPFEVCNRPLPELVIVLEREIPLGLQPLHVVGDPGVLLAFFRRLPEQGSFRGFGHDRSFLIEAL